MKNKINYGIDAPGIIKGLIIGCIVQIFFYWLAFYLLGKTELAYNICVFGTIATAFSMLIPAFLMILSSWYGKFYQINIMINKIPWKGDEKVLDVGCGGGLVAVKVAKKLNNQGHVTGIDIWNKKDLSSNSLLRTQKNIEIEGFFDKISIEYGDACGLEFEENSFDVVTSNLVIHNIESMEDRFIALDEMLRVTKSGGYVIIQDMFKAHEYFEYYSLSEDIEYVSLSGIQWRTFPFSRIVVVKKK